LDLRLKGAALKEPSHWYTVVVLIENLAKSAGYLARYLLSLERDNYRAIASERRLDTSSKKNRSFNEEKLRLG
jgi:hypothetical protein